MKTQIKKAGDTIVVSMDGKLDFDTHIPLKENLTKLVSESKETPKVIFNLDKLDFVGSSGISSFIQLLKEFNANAPVKPRYCHVKSEFRRIIRAFDQAAPFDFYDSEDRAKKSFDQ